MSKLYLLTGATGFLGDNIVKALLAENKKVRALVLPGDKGASRFPKGVEVCLGNVLNPHDLKRFFDVPKDVESIVIHAAAYVTTAWKYDEKVIKVNVEGTRNIIEECSKSSVSKLVYVSSVHALPELPKGQRMAEVKKFDPNLVKGIYAKSKAMATQLVIDATTQGKISSTIVFLSGLCGPFDYEVGYVTQLLIESIKNRLPAGVKGGYDFVDVRDVAKGVISASGEEFNGEGYILANRFVSIEEIMNLVHQEAGSRLIKLMVPIWLARAFLPFFTLYYKLSKKRPLFSRYSLYTLASNSDFLIEKAKKELGFMPRPFRETVADTLQWLKNERKLEEKK